MRLTCPNCNAQYEVPEDVIPERGRDVQCSNCEHTWFQSKEVAPEPVAEFDPDPVIDPAPIQDAEMSPPQQNKPDPEIVAEHDAEMDTPTAPEQSNTDFDPSDPLTDFDDEIDDTPIAPRVPKRNLDPEVVSVLREEAEREKKAREAETLEYQPDLGIDQQDLDPILKPKNGDDTVFFEPKLEELEDLYDQGTQEEARKRSELQDIDELNSTLLGDDRIDVVEKIEPTEPEDVVVQKNNSRSGFIFAFVVLALLLWLYANAQAVGTAVPQAQGILTAYVSVVDTLRNGINGLAQTVMGLIQ